MERASLLFEAAAEAEDIPDLFRRLEASEVLVPLDPEVEPQTFRGAILSQDERDDLRQIRNVIRQGYVQRLEVDRIVLHDGTVPTDEQQVHVDCTASGVDTPPSRPIFGPDRLTVQYIIAPGIVPFSAAITAYIEANRDDDAEKNRLCPPNSFTGDAEDYIRNILISQRARAAWREEPDIQDWIQGCRLRFDQGMDEHLEDPSVLERIGEYREPAIENLERLHELVESST